MRGSFPIIGKNFKFSSLKNDASSVDPSPGLLNYNQHIILYEFNVYKVMIWYTYTKDSLLKETGKVI